MLGQLLFTISMVTYWLSEGCTEGYTWASKKERKENKLIFGAIHKGKRDGVGYLDYHAWRLGENIGMVGSIFSAFLFTSFWSLSLTFLGSWMIGYFVYERALNYVVTDDPFVIKGPWKMMGIEIPRSNAFDWAVAGIGLGLIILSIFI